VYLDWSLYPIVTDIGLNGGGFHEVTFRDARFMNDNLLTRGRKHAALGATVYVDQENHVQSMLMGRRQQH
jgi:inner membrane protein